MITIYDDYVSSVSFLNYPLYRKGEKEWRKQHFELEEDLRNKFMAGFIKKLKGKTVFCHEEKDAKYYLEFTPGSSEYFYEYTVENGIITNRDRLWIDRDYEVIGDARFVDSGTLKPKGGKLVYHDEVNERNYKFHPIGNELEQYLSTTLPDRFQWVYGKWQNWEDNNRFYEISPDGRYELFYSNSNGEFVLEGKGICLVLEQNISSVTLLFCDDEGRSNSAKIETTAATADENTMSFVNGRESRYHKYPEWLNNDWIGPESHLTINYNVLTDSLQVLQKYARGSLYGGGWGYPGMWSVTVGKNIVYLTSYDDMYRHVVLYLDRTQKRLGIKDKNDIVREWLYNDVVSGVYIDDDTDDDYQESYLYKFQSLDYPGKYMDYYHVEWSTTGIIVNVVTENEEAIALRITQHPVEDGEHILLEDLAKREPVHSIILTIKTENGRTILYDERDEIAAYVTSLPYDGFCLKGKEGLWFLGEYGFQ